MSHAMLKTESLRGRWLQGARWFAGVLGVGAALMVAATAFDARADEAKAMVEQRGSEPPPAMWMGGPPHEGHWMARLLQRLNLSEAQKTKLKALAQSQRQDMQRAHETRQALHQEMLNLFKQPTLDEAALNVLRAKVLAHHQDMASRHWQASIDMARILTAEQRQKMADLMAQHMAHDSGKHGSHGRHGRFSGTEEERDGHEDHAHE